MGRNRWFSPRRAAALLVIALLVISCSSTRDGRGRNVILLHFNDFHGQLEPYSEPKSKRVLGGIARISGTVKRIREQNPETPVILLFAGDMLQGTITSSLYYGIPDIEFFNDMKVDAAAVGNHEFDYGQDRFRQLVAKAKFPFLSANLSTWGEPFQIRKYVILKSDKGPGVAVIGLTTPELVTTTHPRNAVGIQMTDPVKAAVQAVKELRGKADMVVVLSHLGVPGDREIADKVAGVDIVIGGHNHYMFEDPVFTDKKKKVPIVQAGERGKYLGRIDMKMKGSTAVVDDYRLIPITSSSPVDEAMAAKVKELSAKADAEVMNVVGWSTVLLDGTREVVRRQESNLGDLAADLCRQFARTQVALLNGGLFRDSIRAGRVRIKDILNVFPFRNDLFVGKLTGAKILEALNQSASLNPDDNPGGFLQVSGIRFTIEEGKAVNVRIAGRPVDPEAAYTVVTSDFLAEGGDGYESIKAMTERVATGRIISDLFIDAFRQKRVIGAWKDGRIVRKAPPKEIKNTK